MSKLEQLLDPGLPAINPLDGWGAGGADAPEKMADCFAALLTDSGASIGAVVHDRGPNSEVYSSYLNYFSKGHAAARKPVFLVANRHGRGSDDLASTSTSERFPLIDGVCQFLVVTRCLFNLRDCQQRKTVKLKEVDKKAVDYWKKSLRDNRQVSESQASQCSADFVLPMLR